MYNLKISANKKINMKEKLSTELKNVNNIDLKQFKNEISIMIKEYAKEYLLYMQYAMEKLTGIKLELFKGEVLTLH